MTVPLDALVRGRAGSTERIVEGRVYRVSPFGWVALVGADQRQHIIYEPEVVGDPRPVVARTDIPARLR